MAGTIGDVNIHRNITRILCFGDSNTWGAEALTDARLPSDKRWTGRLQDLLGDSFEVIEEGLCGRTTNFDDDKPESPGKNGLHYLVPCVDSHTPFDCCILWLGTNDCKTRFKRTHADIAVGLTACIKTIQLRAQTAQGLAPKIVLIVPTAIREEYLKENTSFSGRGKFSEQLSELYSEIAAETSCTLVDLNTSISSSEEDGVHLSIESHEEVAKHLKKEVLRLCQ